MIQSYLSSSSSQLTSGQIPVGAAATGLGYECALKGVCQLPGLYCIFSSVELGGQKKEAQSHFHRGCE